MSTTLIIIIGCTANGLFLLWIACQLYEDFVGKKCSHCKCRTVAWLQWHQMDKDDYRGYIWCPVCLHESWEGFQDRVFG